jgi:signal transduction histidine kinase
MTSFSISCVLTGVVSAILGLFVLAKNSKNSVNVYWCLASLSVALWSVGLGLMTSATEYSSAVFWLRIHYLGAILIPILYLHFVIKLLGYQEYFVLRLSYGIGAIFMVLSFSGHLVDAVPKGPFNFYTRGLFLYPAYAVFFACVAVYAHYLLVKEYRQVSSKKRDQVKFLLLGTGIAFLGGSTAFFPVFDWPIFPFGMYLVALYVVMVGYSIIRYNLMDIQTVIHKTAMWVVTSALYVIPIGLVLFATKKQIEQFPLWLFLLMIAALFLVNIPYMRIVQPRIDQLFQRRLYDLRAILDRFIRDVAIVKSIPELSEKLVSTIRTVLYAEPTTLLLWHPREQRYAATDGSIGITADDAWLVWLKQREHMVELAEVMAESDQPAADAAKAYAARTDALFCLPLHRDGQLIGVVNVGPKQNLQRYSQPEREFLETLRAEVSIALTNSLLYDEVTQMSEELRQWGLELEQRVEEKTRELKEAQSQLIQSEKLAAHGLLAAGVLHEINNPLSFSRGSLSVLKRALARVKEASQGTMGPLLGEVERAAEIIQNGHERIAAIVRDLKMFAKRDVEGIKLSDLHQGLDATLSLLRHELGDRITIVRDYGDIGLVEADAAQVNQVFLNLLHNALQAIAGAGAITIKTWKEGERVFISIRDTGAGIDPEHLPRIFEPFFTTKPVGQGTGLGLSVSHRIIAEHSGQMTVQSLLGRGTEFVIELPARQTAAAAHAVR